MHRGTAVNCNFKDNHAEYDGGAMMDGNAEGCTFANNSAGSNGGAMNGGTFWNCTFVNNSAGEDGDDTYNAIVFKPVLNASNFTSAYDSRDKLQITLTTLAGVQITDANVTIRVYKDNTLIGTFTCPVMDGWIVNLGAGSYIAVLSVENQGYEVDSINVTLTIAKINTKITSSNVKKTYNVSKKLVFILKDSYGKLLSNCKVSIVINGNTYNRNTDSKGKISFTLPNLVPKTYAVKLTFAGNQNLKASNAKVNVVVKKAVPKLTAKAKKFKAKKKTKKYTIKLKTNKNKALKKVKVTLKIKGKTYKKKTNSKGKAVFKIKKLTKKGKYKAVVKFKGNKCYKKVTKKVKITVK